MKKLGAILSSAVIMIALLLPMSASALSGSGRLSGPSAVRVNNTFNVAFSVNADSDFYGIQGSLDYNSSQLQLVSVSGAKGGWTVNNSGRVVTADDNSLSTHTKGSNTFFNARFKVKSSAQVGQKISVKYNYFITDGSSKSSSAATFTSSIVAPHESNKPTAAAKTTRKTDTKGTETSEATEATEATEETTVKKGNPLALNSMTVKDFAISPKFNPDQKEYIVWLPYETENIDISALPVNENSKVEIKGGKDLKAGKANTVKVICTAEDGKKQVYTIKAMRAPINGVYASQTNAKTSSKDDTKPGTPMWLTIVLCVACVLIGFIFALIISSIKRKRDLGPYDDSDDMLGLDLFDHDDDTETNSNNPKNGSNFDGIKFPETNQKNKAKKSNRIENEQNNKRMYIKPDVNTFNGNGQLPNNRENTITVDSKPPVMPQPPKPIKPPMQRPVQPQAPVQSPVHRSAQQQVSKQPPVHTPAQQQVQPPVHTPVQQQVPTQPPVHRSAQQQVSKQPPVHTLAQQQVQPPLQRPVQQQVPTQPPVQRPVQQPITKQPLMQRPTQQQVTKQPPVQRPKQPQAQKPVQPVIEKPVQPKVKQAQPKVEKPVQPKTQIKSGASIEVGEKMDNIKPNSSASPKKSEAPKKEVEKMKLPYTAAGAPQPEQQLKKKVASKQTKKLPRNPFELSADD